jgi:hypothetical protein
MALIVAAASFYFSREEVVIVSDDMFTALYSKARVDTDRALVSLSLLRPVVIANVNVDAENSIVATAAKNASARPYIIIFPFRFADGARYYVEQLETEPEYQKAPVYVLSQANEKPSYLKGENFVRIDILTDLYRAGFAAGFFAQEYQKSFAVGQKTPSSIDVNQSISLNEN